jgi:tRNA A22 N-methylase
MATTNWDHSTTITLGGSTLSDSIYVTSPLSTGVTWTTGTSPSVTLSDTIDWGNINNDSSLKVSGDAVIDGDLTVGGKSIMKSLEAIEERLAILKPNEELEDRWDELRELRNRYMKLEQEIIEKEKMWAMLKK